MKKRKTIKIVHTYSYSYACVSDYFSYLCLWVKQKNCALNKKRKRNQTRTNNKREKEKEIERENNVHMQSEVIFLMSCNCLQIATV